MDNPLAVNGVTGVTPFLVRAILILFGAIPVKSIFGGCSDPHAALSCLHAVADWVAQSVGIATDKVCEIARFPAGTRISLVDLSVFPEYGDPRPRYGSPPRPLLLPPPVLAVMMVAGIEHVVNHVLYALYCCDFPGMFYRLVLEAFKALDRVYNVAPGSCVMRLLFAYVATYLGQQAPMPKSLRDILLRVWTHPVSGISTLSSEAVLSRACHVAKTSLSVYLTSKVQVTDILDPHDLVPLGGESTICVSIGRLAACLMYTDPVGLDAVSQQVDTARSCGYDVFLMAGDMAVGK